MDTANPIERAIFCGIWIQAVDIIATNAHDPDGDVWTVGMSTDYIYRLNPDTGAFIEYLLPTLSANLRKIDADNSATPVTIWVAEVHQGKLAKIEPQP